MADADDDERVSLKGLDPLAALKALLQVDPKAFPVRADEKPQPAQPSKHDDE